MIFVIFGEESGGFIAEGRVGDGVGTSGNEDDPVVRGRGEVVMNFFDMGFDL